MKLIRENRTFHVSNDTLEEFENVLLNDRSLFNVAVLHKLVYIVKFTLFRLFRKAGFELYFSTSKRWRNPLKDDNHLFVLMMGLNEYKIRPYNILTKHGRSVFLFDAWTSDHEEISDFANKFKIDYLFVTASQAAVAIKPKLHTTKIYWVPEGINPTIYKQDILLADKQIDVLALGRKYDIYHEIIKIQLKEKGYNYLYEKEKGELIFPTREEFIEGLSKTKISICVPSNITHPERAGDVETMTIRYLQSIVSKCLIVGHAPAEMIELFGYNPVIEIDMDKPVEQLLEVLNDFERYIPLIEQNYKVVIDNHTWSNRWEQMKNIWNKQVY